MSNHFSISFFEQEVTERTEEGVCLLYKVGKNHRDTEENVRCVM